LKLSSYFASGNPEQLLVTQIFGATDKDIEQLKIESLAAVDIKPKGNLFGFGRR
jgi:hypothetical protein